LRRVVWNLRADAPAPQAAAQGPAGGGRAGQAGGLAGGQAPAQGRGGAQAALVAPGRYQAVLGKLEGEKVTPLGPSQSFFVVQIPQ